MLVRVVTSVGCKSHRCTDAKLCSESHRSSSAVKANMWCGKGACKQKLQLIVCIAHDPDETGETKPIGVALYQLIVVLSCFPGTALFIQLPAAS